MFLFPQLQAWPVASWDHARRYFVDVSHHDPVLCATALAYIRELYQLERKIDGKPPNERRDARKNLAAPILREFQE